MTTQAEIDNLRDHITMLEQRLAAVSPFALGHSKGTVDAIIQNFDAINEVAPYVGMLHRFYVINRLQLKSVHDSEMNEELFKAMQKAQYGNQD